MQSALSGKKKAIAGWCFYDWAMSAFNTIILTFVFGVYVTKGIAIDPNAASAAWAMTLGAAGAVVAILSPILGAVADRGGTIKPWLACLTAVATVATAALWFAKPDPVFLPWALFFVGLGVIAFELANVFYNAMLPRISPAAYWGRVSGWGWGLGYFGGLLALVACLVLLLQAERPLFGLLTRQEAEPVRATALLTALWYAVFSLPLFLWVRESRVAARPPMRQAISEGLAGLLGTLRALPRQPNLLRFFAASALWREGINTITAFGGIYAGIVFGMTEERLIVFAIVLNAAAGLGAIAFGWLDDGLGVKPTLIIALLGLVAATMFMLVVGTPWWAWAPHPGLPLDFTSDQQWLLIGGLALGCFFGPAQASARALMARLTPTGYENEYFGLYALTGRAAGVIGPLLYGAAVATFSSQRAGMATALAMLVFGLVGLFAVRTRRP
jgi:MFS transporter, UMF1 family